MKNIDECSCSNRIPVAIAANNKKTVVITIFFDIHASYGGLWGLRRVCKRVGYFLIFFCVILWTWHVE